MIAKRWAAPEPPNPKAVGAFLQHLNETGFGPERDKRSLFKNAGNEARTLGK